MSFLAFCRAHGITISQTPPYGVWKRYPTDDHPKKRNGAVKFMDNYGFVQNHALMTEVAVWQSDKPVTEEQLKKQSAELAEMRRRDHVRRNDAVKQMRAYFAGLKPLRYGHPYLTNKGLSMQGCEGLRVDGDQLVIPMMRAGFLMSLQTITPDGEKKYRYNCPIKGASFVMSRRLPIVTCLCEGYATGLAVYQSIPQASVIVCFDAGNMVNVAKEINLTGMAVVCADNDWKTEQRIGTNTGLLKGKEAAEAIKCGLAYPHGIEGSDWADALAELGDLGAMKVRTEIMRRVKPVFM